MSSSAAVIGGCAAVTFAIKAAGPVALGGRQLPLAAQQILGLLAPGLLAALVVVSTLADGKHWAVGAETAGVAVAGLVYWRSRSIVACVVIAAVATAVLRAL
ncbi:MAG: AzlD domain-containing protein [Solirubrobacteraceae bacterium]